MITINPARNEILTNSEVSKDKTYNKILSLAIKFVNMISNSFTDNHLADSIIYAVVKVIISHLGESFNVNSINKIFNDSISERIFNTEEFKSSEEVKELDLFRSTSSNYRPTRKLSDREFELFISSNSNLESLVLYKEHLYTENGQISEERVSGLKNLKNLKHLHFSDCGNMSKSIKHLSSLPIKQLVITLYDIDEETARYLGSMIHLDILGINFEFKDVYLVNQALLKLNNRTLTATVCSIPLKALGSKEEEEIDEKKQIIRENSKILSEISSRYRAKKRGSLVQQCTENRKTFYISNSIHYW